MADKKYKPFRVLRVKKTDDLKTIYAKAKKAFTAEDLLQYLQEEEMYPAEQLLKELEAIHREGMKKRKSKKAN